MTLFRMIVRTVTVAALASAALGAPALYAKGASDPPPTYKSVWGWADVFGYTPPNDARAYLAARPGPLQPLEFSGPLEAPSDHRVYLGYIAIELNNIPVDGKGADKYVRLVTDVRRAVPSFFKGPIATFRGYQTTRPDDALSTTPLADWDDGVIGAIAEMNYRELGPAVDRGTVSLTENTTRSWTISSVREGVFGNHWNLIALNTKVGLYRDRGKDVFVIRYAARFLDWMAEGKDLKKYNEKIWKTFARQLIAWLKKKKNITGRVKSEKFRDATVGELIPYLRQSRPPLSQPTWPIASASEKTQSWAKYINVPEIVASGKEPRKDWKYIENAIKALGISGWGGPFFLVPEIIDGDMAAEVYIPRNTAALITDPFDGKSVGRLDAVYKSKDTAEAALKKLGVSDMYTFYVGPGGFIYPTVISDTTAPKISSTMRLALEKERKDAAAARNAMVDLLFWYVGARAPLKARQSSAAMPDALKSFSSTEVRIIKEAKAILNSKEFIKITKAHKSGNSVEVHIAGRTVLYEPNLPASGLTMFGENGFIIGREAFKSRTELSKTVLHELYRLTASTVKTAGATQARVARETAAAAKFAERAFKAAF